MRRVTSAQSLHTKLHEWLSASISNRITFSALLLAVAVALVLGLSSYTVVAYLLSKTIKAELNGQARLTIQRVQGDLNALSSDIATMAGNSFIANGLVDSLGRDTYLLPFLNEHRGPLPLTIPTMLCDFMGRPIASNGRAIPMNDSLRQGIAEVLRHGKPRAELLTFSGGNYLALMHPVIFPPTGHAEGALVGMVPLKELFDAQTRHLGGKYLVRLGSAGRLVAESLRTTGWDDAIAVAHLLALPEPLKGLNLTFHIGLPRSTAQRPLTHLTLGYLFFVAGTLAVVLRSAQGMARRLTRPLISLSMTAERIAASGSVDVAAEVPGNDEVGALATVFNDMLKKLRASHVHLEAQVEKRTRELQEAHDLLELRVDQRTAQLSEAKLRLEREIEMKTQLEQQLRQVQKMEAIGTLAGGIAHDFNNILTVIGSYSMLTSMAMPDGDPLKKNLDHIQSATEKAANLTRSLLAFSRKQVMNPLRTDLNGIVRQVEKFLLRVIGEDIQLRTVLSEAPLPVLVDSGQIEQVLMNLAANARDAMPRGGVLTIESALQQLDGEYLSLVGYNHPGGAFAILTVSDSGCGMDGETIRKIFEPFFTTKPVGKGTGLGMAMVYGIVKQHNGHITVYSEPGIGTSLRIFLPAVSQPSEWQEGVPAPGSRVAERPGGSETILVAEDDADIREVVTKILRESGYRVISAVDGEDAVEKFARHGDDVSLVLMDIIMPRKSGKDACSEIRQHRPGIKVLFTSGYAADLIKSRGDLQEGADLIMKPVQPVELLRKVREMLDR